MKKNDMKLDINQKIELLREQLHKQTDITNSDTLRLSAELDRLIVQVMKKNMAKLKNF
ncbi:MAG: aspartyl-phosphate phosphatase Spo0E family protein [Firmicutes bacterium]|nr:aspartyl-phosphate phosphatase Spo0E family protein [Bacillota bacterium]